MELTWVLIAVGVAALVLLAIALSYYADKKRTETLKSAAEELGLEFLPEGDSHLQTQLSSFHLFKQGRDRKLRNLVVGDTGEITIAIFDYKYTTGGGKESHTWRQTVASIESEQLDVPAFTMRPEGFFDKLGSVFGAQDIDFDSHPEFSKMFVLKSDVEDQLRKFFDDSVLAFFQNKSGLSIEARRGRMIIYRSAKRLNPAQLKSFLEEAYQVYGLFVDRRTALAKT